MQFLTSQTPLSSPPNWVTHLRDSSPSSIHICQMSKKDKELQIAQFYGFPRLPCCVRGFAGGSNGKESTTMPLTWV